MFPVAYQHFPVKVKDSIFSAQEDPTVVTRLARVITTPIRLEEVSSVWTVATTSKTSQPSVVKKVADIALVDARNRVREVQEHIWILEQEALEA